MFGRKNGDEGDEASVESEDLLGEVDSVVFKEVSSSTRQAESLEHIPDEAVLWIHCERASFPLDPRWAPCCLAHRSHRRI